MISVELQVKLTEQFLLAHYLRPLLGAVCNLQQAYLYDQKIADEPVFADPEIELPGFLILRPHSAIELLKRDQ
jgi:hypothetical protein